MLRQKSFLSAAVIVAGSLMSLGIYLVLAWFNEEPEGGGDAIVHYGISRYSWNHPLLFLDLWGKPLFTFFSSPFSQFGIGGLIGFNMVCSLATGLVCYGILKELTIKTPWLPIFILPLFPLWSLLSSSTMTEIFLGLIFSLALFLAVRKRFLGFAILVSFAPFARPEGWLLIVLGLPFLIGNGKYRLIPFLGTGLVIIGLWGAFLFKDIFWLFTSDPYMGKSAYHNAGDFFHFFKRMGDFSGWYFFSLALLGSLLCLFLKTTSYVKFPGSPLLILLGWVWLYVLAHSYLFWKGSLGSAGLLRTLAPVLPGFAILISITVSRMLEPIKNHVFVIVLAFVFMLPVWFEREKTDFIKPDSGDTWLKKDIANEIKRNLQSEPLPVFSTDPTIWYYCDLDPYDVTRFFEVSSLNKIPFLVREYCFFWDGHFGPTEKGVFLSELINKPNLQLLFAKEPYVPQHSFEGNPVAGYLFKHDTKAATGKSNPEKEILFTGAPLSQGWGFFLKSMKEGFVCHDLSRQDTLMADRASPGFWEAFSGFSSDSGGIVFRSFKKAFFGICDSGLALCAGVKEFNNGLVVFPERNGEGWNLKTADGRYIGLGPAKNLELGTVPHPFEIIPMGNRNSKELLKLFPKLASDRK
jgi:hypothetical protein